MDIHTYGTFGRRVLWSIYVESVFFYFCISVADIANNLYFFPPFPCMWMKPKGSQQRVEKYRHECCRSSLHKCQWTRCRWIHTLIRYRCKQEKYNITMHRNIVRFNNCLWERSIYKLISELWVGIVTFNIIVALIIIGVVVCQINCLTWRDFQLGSTIQKDAVGFVVSYMSNVWYLSQASGLSTYC